MKGLGFFRRRLEGMERPRPQRVISERASKVAEKARENLATVFSKETLSRNAINIAGIAAVMVTVALLNRYVDSAFQRIILASAVSQLSFYIGAKVDKRGRFEGYGPAPREGSLAKWVDAKSGNVLLGLFNKVVRKPIGRIAYAWQVGERSRASHVAATAFALGVFPGLGGLFGTAPLAAAFNVWLAQKWGYLPRPGVGSKEEQVSGEASGSQNGPIDKLQPVDSHVPQVQRGRRQGRRRKKKRRQRKR